MKHSLNGTQRKHHCTVRKDNLKTLAQIEREAIELRMRQFKGDKVAVAKALGVGKTTIYRKLLLYAKADRKKAKR